MTEHGEASDDQLTARLRGGDHGAVDLLRQRHLAAARRVAVSLLGEDGPVDEAVAEAFARVLSRLLAGPGEVAFRPMLLHAVRRAAESRRSATSRLAAETPAPVEELFVEPPGGPAPDGWGAATGDQDATPGPRVAPGGEPVLVPEAATAPPPAPSTDLVLVPVADDPSVRAAAPGPALRRRAVVRRHLRDEVDPRCRAVVGRLEAYLAGDLPRAEEEEVADHLAGCARCHTLYVDLSDDHPGLRSLVVPVAVLMAVIALAIVPARLRGPSGSPPSTTVTVEMADTSDPTASRSPVRATTTAAPATTAPPATAAPTTTVVPQTSPPPTSAVPGSTEAPASSTSTSSPDAGEPGPGPGGSDSPAGSDGGGAGTWDEPSFGLVGDSAPGSAAPSVPTTVAPAVAEDLAHVTVTASGVVKPWTWSPVTLTVANPTGTALGNVRFDVSTAAGATLVLSQLPAGCTDGTGVSCAWPALAPGATELRFLVWSTAVSGPTLPLHVSLVASGLPPQSTTLGVPFSAP